MRSQFGGHHEKPVGSRRRYRAGPGPTPASATLRRELAELGRGERLAAQPRDRPGSTSTSRAPAGVRDAVPAARADVRDAVGAADPLGPQEGADEIGRDLVRHDRDADRLAHQAPTDIAAARSAWTPSSRSSTGIRSSAEWMSRAASSPSIALCGKKPYATVPNASRIQCESVKPAQTSGASRAPGSSSLDPALERRPERRLHRRAGAAVALVPLELVVARADRRPHERIDVLGRHPRRQPAVDRDDAGGRDHVALLRGLDHRRRQREREQRLDELGRERVQRPRALECHLERRQLAEHELEEPRHLGNERLRRRDSGRAPR